jgi:hypothetical protein
MALAGTRVARAVKFLIAALLVAVLPLGATAAENAPLEGVYAWKGVDVDGESIGGLVHVIRHGDSFLIAWLLHPDDPLPAAVGIGVAAEGMLAVLFYGPLTDAVVLYRIEDGGHRLVGRWVAVGGDGVVYPDVLTRLPDEMPSAAETGALTQPCLVGGRS